MNEQQDRIEYLQARIARLHRRCRTLEKRYNRLATLRLLIFFGGMLLSTVLFFLRPAAGLVCFGLIAPVFGIAAWQHQRLAAALKRFRMQILLDGQQIARIRLDWPGIPPEAPSPAAEGHPFENDLDISGPCSLHRLLDVSLSKGGSERLRNWLLEREPDLAQIHRRQTLVRELGTVRRLRERLAMSFALVARGKLDGKAFVDWLERDTFSHSSGAVYTAALILAGVNLLLFGVWAAGMLPPWFLLSFAFYALILLQQAAHSRGLFEDALLLADEFGIFRNINHVLEQWNYRATPELAALCQPWRDARPRPSQLLAKIGNIVLGISVRANPLLALLLNAVFPWDFTFARKLERARRTLRERLPAWLEVLYELEALVSLANYAWLNPAARFPEVSAATPEHAPLLHAESAAHPLLPQEQAVRNSFYIAGRGSIALITGSNMSGKSTFLRTLGLNLRLAYAGAPVNCTALRCSVFRMYTCIRVSDSVTDGISYFYAEVRRLRGMLDELRRAASMPVFLLIDEIFKGTNNVERLVGSRSYIKALGHTNGLGLIATHDLELTALENDIAQLCNYHFREHIENGVMRFDYTLRSGPCPTTNALKIMQLEGLPVETFSGGI